LISFTLHDQSSAILKQHANKQDTVPVLGLFRSGRGSISVYGDSTCVDSAVAQTQQCHFLVEQLLDFALYKKVPELFSNMQSYMYTEQDVCFTNSDEEGVASEGNSGSINTEKFELPQRMEEGLLLPYSKVPQGNTIVSSSFVPQSPASANATTTIIKSQQQDGNTRTCKQFISTAGSGGTGKSPITGELRNKWTRDRLFIPFVVMFGIIVVLLYIFVQARKPRVPHAAFLRASLNLGVNVRNPMTGISRNQIKNNSNNNV